MAQLQQQATKRETLNLRIKPELRGLIDRAAQLSGKNRTDFVLAAARHAAEDALMDSTQFAVSPKAYAEFLSRLDAPPRPNPVFADRSKRLLHGRSKLAFVAAAARRFARRHHFLLWRACSRRLAQAPRPRQPGQRSLAHLRPLPGHSRGGLLRPCFRRNCRQFTPGRFRRNMPNPIPVVVLARLAVDKDCRAAESVAASSAMLPSRGTGRRCHRHSRHRCPCHLRNREELLPRHRLRSQPTRTHDPDGHSG